MNEKTVRAFALQGSFTALITPFKRGEREVDYDTLESLVQRQIQAETDGLVVLGTTAETPTLTNDERQRIIRTVVREVDSRIPVIVGTGTNCTRTTIEQTKIAASLGADGVLVVTPYYNMPDQDGLKFHFQDIAKDTKLPIILYNVPKRTGVCLSKETIIELSEEYENIVGLKQATGSLNDVYEITNSCHITVMSGDDHLTLPMMKLGAKGVISVLGNLMPQAMRELTHWDRYSSFEEFREVQYLHRVISGLATKLSEFGPNPVPIKAAMAIKGLCGEQVRSPLCELELEKVVKDFLEVIEYRHLLDSKNKTSLFPRKIKRRTNDDY